MGDLQCDRAEFIKMLQQRYGQSHSLSESIGLLIIDLRDFRRVNAVYGFELGDFVLQQTQQRLSHAGFKEGEVWRIGNDEFGLVLSSVRDPKLLSLAANKVVRVFGEPYQCKDRLIRIEPCIGIASQFVGALHAEELLVMAEANLQEAKLQNKRFLLYDPKEHIKPSDWQFESDLHKAVVNNCLQLYYQAKVDMRSQLPTHAEALARWPRPERGLTGPSDFIPLLEKNGAIVDMTKWVVHTALREMAEWPICPMVDNYSVAVNVSSFVLEDPEFYHMVKSALGIWGVDSERLTLEITEGALIQEEQSSYQNIYRLKDLGLKNSIDDFGTDYS